jgi:S1-C subfamily serine protease
MFHHNPCSIAPPGASQLPSRIILLGLAAFLCLLLACGAAAADIRRSIVKIYCVENRPDYDNPWNMRGPQSSSGSGCVIDNHRILTNAHVVSDQTYLQVRLHGQSKKFPARVLAVSHDADLALLTVDQPGFFEGILPLQLGELPNVQDRVVVYGFPKGGDTLSSTSGVVSRIEHQYYAHSLMRLLAAQIDAPINPGNSGGPAMTDGRIVGVVMQTLGASDGIGYIVPVPVIAHFLADIRDGRYDGFPQLGLTTQTLENNNLRRMYALENHLSGTLVTGVHPGSPAAGIVFPGDIVTLVDGHPVADDGTVAFRPNERTEMSYFVQQHQVGEELELKVFRGGRERELRIRLSSAWGRSRLVPMTRYDVRPTYFIYGGLVFSPLTLNYLMSWGDSWQDNAPPNLLNYFVNGRPAAVGEEAVILIKVLSAELNSGYEDFTNSRIIKVNGREIKNLKDLVTIIREADEDFAVFENEQGHLLALDRGKVASEQATILERYNIPLNCSEDLLPLETVEEADPSQGNAELTLSLSDNKISE